MLINAENFLIDFQVYCGGGHRIFEYSLSERKLDFINKSRMYTIMNNGPNAKKLEVFLQIQFLIQIVSRVLGIKVNLHRSQFIHWTEMRTNFWYAQAEMTHKLQFRNTAQFQVTLKKFVPNNSTFR